MRKRSGRCMQCRIRCANSNLARGIVEQVEKRINAHGFCYQAAQLKGKRGKRLWEAASRWSSAALAPRGAEAAIPHVFPPSVMSVHYLPCITALRGPTGLPRSVVRLCAFALTSFVQSRQEFRRPGPRHPPNPPPSSCIFAPLYLNCACS